MDDVMSAIVRQPSPTRIIPVEEGEHSVDSYSAANVDMFVPSPLLAAPSVSLLVLPREEDRRRPQREAAD